MAGGNTIGGNAPVGGPRFDTLVDFQTVGGMDATVGTAQDGPTVPGDSKSGKGINFKEAFASFKETLKGLGQKISDFVSNTMGKIADNAYEKKTSGDREAAMEAVTTRVADSGTFLRGNSDGTRALKSLMEKAGGDKFNASVLKAMEDFFSSDDAMQNMAALKGTYGNKSPLSNPNVTQQDAATFMDLVDDLVKAISSQDVPPRFKQEMQTLGRAVEQSHGEDSAAIKDSFDANTLFLRSAMPQLIMSDAFDTGDKIMMAVYQTAQKVVNQSQDTAGMKITEGPREGQPSEISQQYSAKYEDTRGRLDNFINELYA